MLVMKKNIVLILVTIGLFGCGVNKQAQQIKALKDCEYKITTIADAKFAGTDIKKLLDDGEITLTSLPGVALGLLRKNIPLNATLNLEIKNPTSAIAAVNQFDYKVLINRTELAEGTVTQNINIAQGKSVTVPVSIRSNLYGLLTDQNILNDVMKAAKKGSKDDEALALLTIKIRPTFMIGNTPVKYPGYITIDKVVTSKLLF